MTIEADLEAEYPWLRRQAPRFVRTRVAMDDLAQETFLRAWNKREQFQPGTCLQAWLYVIMRNVHYAWLRRKAVVFDSDLADRASMFAEQPASQYHHVLLRELGDAIEKLPPVYRRALYASANQEPIREGNRKYATPVGTKKSRQWRARRMVEESYAP